MYQVNRNNFYKNEKNATVYTPYHLSNFIYHTINDKIPKNSFILDPCVGKGSLLNPWLKNDYNVIGIDIEDQGFQYTKQMNYLLLKKGEIDTPNLVIMNPPFNVDIKTKHYIKENYSGRPLLPEVWLSKSIELFGKDIPMIMFTPYGFRLNQTLTSKRWQKFAQGDYPEISSIISLPKNVFENILFHSEILIFNIDGLKGHYFYG